MSHPLKVALLQLRAFDLEHHHLAWQTMLRAIDESAGTEPDLIVLPEASYPAYFLHSRATYDAAHVRSDAEILGTLSERAERYGTTIAAGLVLHARDAEGGAPEVDDARAGANGFGTPASTPSPLENVCAVFGPDGREVTRYSKAFLWHFDTHWFTPGRRMPVFEVRGATAGALVCADGRLPEVARTLAVEGARLLIDSTAWVSTGRDRGALSTPQVDYFMRARAIENGAWVVAADKVGIEAKTLVYAGRSGVINPRGEWVVQAPSDSPGIVTFTLELDQATGPPVGRRPELYGGAALPSERTEASSLAREPLIAEDAAARVAAAALNPEPSAVELMEKSRTIVRALSAQDSALVVLPDLAGPDTRSVTQHEFLPLFAELSAETGTMLAVVLAEREAGNTYKTQYFLERGSLIASHRQTHLDERELEAGFSAGDIEPPVIDTAVGYVGLLAGSEGLVPELARSLKLRGAEFLAWSAGPLPADLRVLARSRAAENRAYALVAGTSRDEGGAYVVDPSGSVLAESLSGEQMGVSADVNRAIARWNDMAPGTNPVRDRDVETFAALWR